jgi:signal transduction histidine kinase
MTELCADPAHALPVVPGLRMQLVDVVNHELRTPLTALLGHAELLQDLDLPEQARRSVDSIVHAGERLRALADRVTAMGEVGWPPA